MEKDKKEIGEINTTDIKIENLYDSNEDNKEDSINIQYKNNINNSNNLSSQKNIIEDEIKKVIIDPRILVIQEQWSQLLDCSPIEDDVSCLFLIIRYV